ncbi:N-acetyl-gamma-glutamyl-phosphate reductase [Scopulibacillus darangshiensis]|uniref:N-acetyl-gamma-glutamyl-phosphate reductase n=1 Tax=Scopulibacillus darangshiensis TaxID=442528 RepID=A0A4R2P1Y3_9BACL|nr:N-acetyl-gamma-glutamyl-phosphate reductase [Scopulibacillus darangshiensis]TCP28719.1 N-acetyl-gamma-glutamyl-phosphate reductase [Scopulibacillus darangshiensis]
MKVGIIGANGYSGVELIRLLKQHPNVDIEMLISHSTSGKNVKELYPHLSEVCEKTLESIDVQDVSDRVDLLFFATPSGVSQGLVPKFINKGVPCIDLSGDFRLKDPDAYTKWYQKQGADRSDLEQAVYGLAEINHKEIKEAKLIANPGCYPTASLLGILPAIKMGITQPDTLIIDGKSGISGAGRGVSIGSHFCEVNENIKAYKLGSHQHIPEIEQTIQDNAGIDTNISFSPHLVPMTRGIMCTIYADLKQQLSTEEIVGYYKDFYHKSHFVRVREPGVWPATKEVYGSNYCDIGLIADSRTNRLTVVSVIDNVVKGASGQAVQNMNLLNGWDEWTGLNLTPVYP